MSLVTQPSIWFVDRYRIAKAEVISRINLNVVGDNRIALSRSMNRIMENEGRIRIWREVDSIIHKHIHLAIAIRIVDIASTRWMNYQMQLIDTITAAG